MDLTTVELCTPVFYPISKGDTTAKVKPDSRQRGYSLFRNAEELLTAVHTIWDNCYVYNGPLHPMSLKAQTLQKDFSLALEDAVEKGWWTQDDVQRAANSTPADRYRAMTDELRSRNSSLMDASTDSLNATPLETPTTKRRTIRLKSTNIHLLPPKSSPTDIPSSPLSVTLTKKSPQRTIISQTSSKPNLIIPTSVPAQTSQHTITDIPPHFSTTPIPRHDPKPVIIPEPSPTTIPSTPKPTPSQPSTPKPSPSQTPTPGPAKPKLSFRSSTRLLDDGKPALPRIFQGKPTSHKEKALLILKVNNLTDEEMQYFLDFVQNMRSNDPQWEKESDTVTFNIDDFTEPELKYMLVYFHFR
ncbi:hypothetical protein BLNAU_13730 [Blattamonas nauphoetae]|uniref:Bromo domain-containing protein n=1 Tax=Blattamonas nauphoetae TaxID=2049346 RepID=A0ABQ9XFW0_9EUKA|nr:hypothetical protein BLNAU_13730 [Blattamonas nauphoetae]